MRVLRLGVVLVAGCGLLVGCRARQVDIPGARADLRVEPQPPRTGPATVSIHLTTAEGAPLSGADLQLEGNMSHAGMTPVFAGARETAPGRYQASLNFTMGGDWFIILTARFPDGRRLERQVPVPGVQSQ